jgi:hypothetical protein
VGPTPEPSFAELYRLAGPLFEQANVRLSARYSVEAVHDVLTWRFLREHLGRDPLDQEHWTAIGVSRATYYRRLARVREAFDVERISEIEIAPAASLPAVGALRLA